MTYNYILNTDYHIHYTNEQKGIGLVAFFANNKANPKESDNGKLTRFIIKNFTHKPNVYELKQMLLDIQKEYDKENEVNSFIYDSRQYWFDKATRVGLINSLNIQKDAGLTETTIWLGTTECKTTIEYALTFLKNLELYAIACNNVTNRHIAEIYKLDTIEDILNFDITADYPDQLVFENNKINE